MAALVREADPNLSWYYVAGILLGTAIDKGPLGPDKVFGGGFLDVYTAVDYSLSYGHCLGGTVEIPSIAYPSGDSVLCIGETSISTIGDVEIQSGANVMYISQTVTLNSGFRVQTGGQFMVLVY